MLDTSRDIKGTNNDWELVELYGKTSDEQDSFTLTLGLGGYSSTNIGKAWFDDVEVIKVDNIPAGINVVDMSKAQASSSSNTNLNIKKAGFSTPMIFYALIFFISLLITALGYCFITIF